MKLLTFRRRGELAARVGAMSGRGEVIDLTSAYAAYLHEKGESDPTGSAQASIPMDMVEFIRMGQASLKSAATAIAYVEERGAKGTPLGRNAEHLLMARDQIEFLPPVPRPSKMISAGMNYREHLADSGKPGPEKPVAFLQVPSAFVGHQGDIVWTERTPTLDYEIELAFIIGKRGKYIGRDKAIDYVYGYTIYNDISERTLQLDEMKHGLLLGGKNMDTFAPMGPWIVTKDEIKDPHNLTLILKVNGEVRQHSNTRNMTFNIFDQITYWSSLMTLYQGDIFGTGTPAGVALGRRPNPEPYYLKPGDTVEAEIEGLGALINRVVK
jgi:2-keto-4-pentenoate hydratase/2-oxohepta-3-ene-1,7-dioic acid hydratase in catechol pathway